MEGIMKVDESWVGTLLELKEIFDEMDNENMFPLLDDDFDTWGASAYVRQKLYEIALSYQPYGEYLKNCPEGKESPYASWLHHLKIYAEKEMLATWGKDAKSPYRDKNKELTRGYYQVS